MKEKAGDALRESERKYRTLIEASEDFVFALDLEGKFTFGNTKAVETFGDLKGKPFTIPVLPEYHELVKKNFGRRIRGEKVEPYHIGVVDKKGNKLWVEVSGSPLVKDGKILGAVYFEKDITERKKLEQELRDVLDAAPDAIHVLSQDMRLIRRNAASEKLFPKLQVGDHCYKALHGRDEPCGHCGVIKVFKDGKRHEHESTIKHPDGKVTYVHSPSAPVFDGGGNVIAAVEVLRDITKRKLAEDEVKRSEEKYRQLVESVESSHFLYSHGTDGVFTYLSPSIKKILGYTHKEFMTHYTTYLTPSPVNKDVERHTELSIKGIQQPPYEVEIYHKNGSIRWLSVSESPVFNDSGEVIGVEGIAHDITARKKTEEELLESENKFRTVTEKSLVGVYLIQDGVFRYVNPKLAEIFGYTVEELIDKKGPRNLVLPEDWPTVKENLRKRLTGESESIHYDFRGMTKNKKTVYVDVYGSRTLFHGRPAGYRYITGYH